MHGSFGVTFSLVYFQATGGSGQYSWASDATTIASVNTRGLLTTTTDTGMTQVRAHDSENSMHFGVAQVIKAFNNVSHLKTAPHDVIVRLLF
jgi:hypothetical protein